MAVKMRLTRMGDKKSPFYRIVVADSRVARDAKYIDLIAHVLQKRATRARSARLYSSLKCSRTSASWACPT